MPRPHGMNDNASVSQRRNVDAAKMSDSEIITLSICGELIGMDSENAWRIAYFVEVFLYQLAQQVKL